MFLFVLFVFLFFQLSMLSFTLTTGQTSIYLKIYHHFSDRIIISTFTSQAPVRLSLDVTTNMIGFNCLIVSFGKCRFYSGGFCKTVVRVINTIVVLTGYEKHTLERGAYKVRFCLCLVNVEPSPRPHPAHLPG